MSRLSGTIRTLARSFITGSGGFFSAGGDLKSLRSGEDRALHTRDRIRRLQTWFPSLIHLPKPVVAAVDGPAFGAGFSLALAADVILASPRARFCQVFGRIGVVPDMTSLYLLPRRIGGSAARELILTARAVDAEEGRRLGLLADVVPEECLLTEARRLAARMNTPGSDFGSVKRAMMEAFDRPL